MGDPPQRRRRRARANMTASTDGESRLIHSCYCSSLSLVFLFVPFIIPALLSPSLPVVAQMWGPHSGASSPPPRYGACLRFCREKRSAVSSLVDSRRIVPSPRCYALSTMIDSFFIPFYCCIFARKSPNLTTVGIRTQGPIYECHSPLSRQAISTALHRSTRLIQTALSGYILL